ncbi:hypothetical protein TB2_037243 [Malus domestica]
MPNKSYSHQQSLIASQQQLQCMAYEDQAIQLSCICFKHFPSVTMQTLQLVESFTHSSSRQCEAKPIYGANKSFIKGVQPQFSKASHTLDQDSVKQNQFMVPTRALSIEGNHNSQKLHTLLIKIV